MSTSKTPAPAHDRPIVGLIANPHSGHDIRRLVASAGTSELTDKISIIRRVMLGAASVGEVEWRVLPEPHGLVRRATDTLSHLRVSAVDVKLSHKEQDTTETARRLCELGAQLVVTLGGDGTNRAAALGWPDIPVIPLSTGTNNAFPVFVEPTIAGTVAGLVATGKIPLADAATRAKVIHVEYTGPDGEPMRDLALIDAVGVRDRFVGSMDLFDPETMATLVLTQAEPTAIGFSSIGGRLHPLTAADDGGVLVQFASPSKARHQLIAPTAPGHHERIGYDEARPLTLGERVTVTGPMILAFDGERKVELKPGTTAELWIERDGPRVIDVRRVMASAAAAGLFT